MPTFWVRSRDGASSVTIDAPEIVAGRSEDADLHIDDPRVSRAHCSIRTVGGAWLVRDLGSANGTLLNGNPVLGEVTLHDRDVINLGSSSIVVGLPSAGGASTLMEGIGPPPRLTPREQEVLEALCEPLLGPDPYAEPASVRAIAEQLTVTPDAVKKLLARLYAKFDIEHVATGRRALLARKAILSQAVRPGRV